MTTNPQDKARMFYFGPWADLGHYLHDELGYEVERSIYRGLPWIERWEIDGGIQPEGTQHQGAARVLHKDGWTALTFWDRSVDTRPGSSSTYLAEGDFGFPEMVKMARERFSTRWNRMAFDVFELESE